MVKKNKKSVSVKIIPDKTIIFKFNAEINPEIKKLLAISFSEINPISDG